MTTRSATSRKVTIFEGPDGAGKTTLAREYAEVTNARYVHHGPYKQVSDGLSRMFLESMLPALLGYQDVVLDRCWLSEPIYADAFRDGADRVGCGRSRILDRLALRCGAVVVKCMPPWAHVRACFVDRVADEYLDNEHQLLAVYGDYQHGLNTQLHEVVHDYTQYLGESLSVVAACRIKPAVEELRRRTSLHPTRVLSSGNWDAPIVVVGEDFGAHKNNDPLYQSPFGSLNGNGCSLWLANQLDDAEISEQSLLWINADELERTPDFFAWHRGKHFVCLGNRASDIVRYSTELAKLDRGPPIAHFPHPQYWKRFCSGAPYPLLNYLQETLHVLHSR